MTFVIVMGFYQIIVVMNDVKQHTHTLSVKPDIQKIINIFSIIYLTSRRKNDVFMTLFRRRVPAEIDSIEIKFSG